MRTLNRTQIFLKFITICLFMTSAISEGSENLRRFQVSGKLENIQTSNPSTKIVGLIKLIATDRSFFCRTHSLLPIPYLRVFQPSKPLEKQVSFVGVVNPDNTYRLKMDFDLEKARREGCKYKLIHYSVIIESKSLTEKLGSVEPIIINFAPLGTPGAVPVEHVTRLQCSIDKSVRPCNWNALYPNCQLHNENGVVPGKTSRPTLEIPEQADIQMSLDVSVKD